MSERNLNKNSKLYCKDSSSYVEVPRIISISELDAPYGDAEYKHLSSTFVEHEPTLPNPAEVTVTMYFQDEQFDRFDAFKGGADKIWRFDTNLADQYYFIAYVKGVKFGAPAVDEFATMELTLQMNSEVEQTEPILSSE